MLLFVTSIEKVKNVLNLIAMASKGMSRDVRSDEKKSDKTLNILACSTELTTQMNKHTDIIFEIRGIYIESHKFVLCLWSPVFESMLYDESKDQEIISLPDHNPDTFAMFIAFMYGKTMTCTIDQFFEIFKLSVEYQFTKLYTRMEGQFVNLVNAENAYPMYKRVTEISDASAKICKDIIFENFDLTVQFNCIEQKELYELLEEASETLSGSILFTVINRWKSSLSKTPELIAPDLLKKMYALVNLEEFSVCDLLQYVYPKRIYSDADILAIVAEKFSKLSRLREPIPDYELDDITSITFDKEGVRYSGNKHSESFALEQHENPFAPYD
jgi:hypothetical protein